MVMPYDDIGEFVASQAKLMEETTKKIYENAHKYHHANCSATGIEREICMGEFLEVFSRALAAHVDAQAREREMDRRIDERNKRNSSNLN